MNHCSRIGFKRFNKIWSFISTYIADLFEDMYNLLKKKKI
ncbi:hypothetical protein HMPREF0322_02499 [Desulfitobacterium hafniense DP7]|uniref:Uncharacterized protein n=1 Tax=Desulfitobacterium hafniense DP7 TaxID=537010 RepID=G9XNF7_DESHA|nr:hypothetical protein HMPREF0322_02499 [Desulfitobacterium hafniense DP7]